MRHALPMLAALLASACTASHPAADSTAAPARVDSVTAAPAASVVPAAPAAPTARPDTTPRAATPAPDTQPAARASASTGKDSVTRPGMRPRPPHPVRHRMPGKDTTPMLQPPAGDSQAQDRAVIDQLLRDTKALAHTGGCASAGQCAVLPVGVRACGGPEDYVVYCPRTTDVAALERKASELDSAEKAFNAKYHVMSTCIMKEPPRVTLAGGSCRAAPATPPAR